MLLNKVDQLILANSEHSYLSPEDHCFFFGEYTIRESYSYSQVNQFILNFKKVRSRCSSTYELRYKESAIQQAASLWNGALNTGQNLASAKAATLVPVPPSRAKNDPDYDDRISRMLTSLSGMMGGLDVRELVLQNQSYQASHVSTNRPTPSELAARYSIDESKALPNPTSLWIFDDTLISGSHFKGVSTILSQRFPNTPCYGMFLARGIFKTP